MSQDSTNNVNGPNGDGGGFAKRKRSISPKSDECSPPSSTTVVVSEESECLPHGSHGPSEEEVPLVDPLVSSSKKKTVHPLLPMRAIQSDDDDVDNDVDDDDKTTLISEDGDGDDEEEGYFTKEPILLTIKNALVDFLHEVDPSYGDLITFPVFQEFVRSHTSSLVYGPVKKRSGSNKNKKRS